MRAGKWGRAGRIADGKLWSVHRISTLLDIAPAGERQQRQRDAYKDDDSPAIVSPINVLITTPSLNTASCANQCQLEHCGLESCISWIHHSRHQIVQYLRLAAKARRFGSLSLTRTSQIPRPVLDSEAKKLPLRFCFTRRIGSWSSGAGT